MRTDTALQCDVLDELASEPSIRATDIGVSVQNEIVTLNGDVSTYAEKFAAEHAAKRIAGVRAIVEALNVTLLTTHHRNDNDIAQSVVNALDGNVSVPYGKIKALVEGGWLTLSEDVDWNYQREAAHNAVRHLIGIRGVTNLMQITPFSVPTAEVRSRIESALKRSMTNDANSITIEDDNGKVTLHGNVHSWEEHDDAARAAWSAPGVCAVENDIVIIA